MHHTTNITAIGCRLRDLTKNTRRIVGRRMVARIFRIVDRILRRRHDDSRIVDTSLIITESQHLVVRQQHRKVIVERHKGIGITLGHGGIPDIGRILPTHCRNQYDPLRILFANCRQHLRLKPVPRTGIRRPVVRFIQQFEGQMIKTLRPELGSQTPP